MKLIATCVLIAIIGNLYFTWGTTAVFGWITALAGWLPHMFTEMRARHGH